MGGSKMRRETVRGVAPSEISPDFSQPRLRRLRRNLHIQCALPYNHDGRHTRRACFALNLSEPFPKSGG